jgi:hypothetical protein
MAFGSDLQEIPVRLCSKPDCTGTMHFHEAMQENPWLEWPCHAWWVCSQDSAHIEVATWAERRLIEPILWRKKNREARQASGPGRTRRVLRKVLGLFRPTRVQD